MPDGKDTNRRLQEEIRERAEERKGCRGCPTPSGLTFALSDGSRHGGHFSATHALDELGELGPTHLFLNRRIA